MQVSKKERMSLQIDFTLSSISVQVSLFAELFNEMLQRDFGYRIFKALAAIPAKDEKKEKEKKAKKEAEKKEAEKREIKKEKEEENDEPAVKKSKEDEEEKRKVSLLNLAVLFSHSFISWCVFIQLCDLCFNQGDDKGMKKEESRDEEENEDDGSTANAEEYDPMEAEDAEDDDDDGTAFPSLFSFYT